MLIYYWVVRSEWRKGQFIHPLIDIGCWGLASVPKIMVQTLRTVSSFHCHQNDRNQSSPMRHLADSVSCILLNVCGEGDGVRQNSEMDKTLQSFHEVSMVLSSPPLPCFSFPLELPPSQTASIPFSFSIFILKFIPRIESMGLRVWAA